MAVAHTVNPNKRIMSNVGATTSGNTMVTASDFASDITNYSVDGINFKSVITVNQFTTNISADAALAFGQKIGVFPQGFIKIKDVLLDANLSTPTGLSSTAGEIGLGTVVGSGAVAVLSGTATFEDILTGQTMGNLVAGTPNDETASVDTDSILDGSSTAKSVFLNVASTWNQTAAEDVTIDATATIFWTFLGSGITGGV